MGGSSPSPLPEAERCRRPDFCLNDPSPSPSFPSSLPSAGQRPRPASLFLGLLLTASGSPASHYNCHRTSPRGASGYSQLLQTQLEAQGEDVFAISPTPDRAVQVVIYPLVICPRMSSVRVHEHLRHWYRNLRGWSIDLPR